MTISDAIVFHRSPSARRLPRLVLTAALPLLALACSNNDSGSQGGSGGSAAGSGGTSGGSGGTSGGSGGGSGSGGTSGGSGGTTMGTGGASGTGGTASGTGGADAGTSGDGGIAACVAATATTPLISDFATTMPVSNQANGGTDLWSISPAGMATVMVAGGEMHAQSTGGSWASASTLVSSTKPCVDVSKYTGVKFKIRSATNTSLLFVVVTPETSADSSNFRKTIAVTPTATDVSVAFADLMRAPFGAGMTLPADYKAEAHMRAIGFGVGTQMELMNIYLSNVTFY